MAAIFYFSSLSSPPSTGGIPNEVLHAIEYFGLGVVVFRAIAGGLGAQVTKVRVKVTMLIVVAYAISDEVHQLFVPYRTADIRDVLADIAGASIALIACGAWHIITTPGGEVPKPKSPR